MRKYRMPPSFAAFARSFAMESPSWFDHILFL
jgi:hypothetical protein